MGMLHNSEVSFVGVYIIFYYYWFFPCPCWLPSKLSSIILQAFLLGKNSDLSLSALKKTSYYAAPLERLVIW